MARMRGTAVLQVVKTLRSQREAALKVVPPSLQHYLSEQITRTDWYPHEDYLALLTALVKLMPPGPDDPWERLGRMGLRHDATTVYRGMLVRRASLQESLKAQRDLYHLYEDTGRWVISGDDRSAVVDLFDAPVRADHCGFRTGFMHEYLTMTVGEVRVRKLRCAGRGDPFCRWEIERVC